MRFSGDRVRLRVVASCSVIKENMREGVAQGQEKRGDIKKAPAETGA